MNFTNLRTKFHCLPIPVLFTIFWENIETVYNFEMYSKCNTFAKKYPQ